MIYKKKGDRAICGNSRDISLLSVAGKLLARVMLIRLLTYVVDTVVLESQRGFRRARSNTDMIFVARLLQEKCREQHRNLFIAFIDLTKAFDTVNRDLLWQSWSNLDALHIFLASYGNPTLILVPASSREENCRRVLVLTQELNRAAS